MNRFSGSFFTDIVEAVLIVLLLRLSFLNFLVLKLKKPYVVTSLVYPFFAPVLKGSFYMASNIL